MSWKISDSIEQFKFKNWAESYFDVNQHGNIVLKGSSLRAKSLAGIDIDLYQLAQMFRKQGMRFPLLVRFIDILHDRVLALYESFSNSITQNAYQGSYYPVYPIKVNQQHTVVKHLVELNDYPVGLEAGSKPELIACLAMAPTSCLIICNGYKDEEYIRLAVMAHLLGHNVHIVLEKPSEIDLIIEQQKQFNVKLSLGVRVRLSNLNAGNWQNTGGEKSKFGFSATGLLALVAKIKQSGLTNSLRLLHFHMGSQIAKLADFRHGIREALQYYVQLCQRNIPLQYLDVGGGLAVDYDGTRSNSYFSMSYGIEDYTSILLAEVKQVCDAKQLKHPDIITEAGRAMSAHHGVLFVDVIDYEIKPELARPNNKLFASDFKPEHSLSHLYASLDSSDCDYTNIIKQAKLLVKQLNNDFCKGKLSIEQKSVAEVQFYQLCRKALAFAQEKTVFDIKLKHELEQILADKYFCNLSIFQSLPDIWGIGQIFPIIPLHRLEQKPQRRVLLKDLTCDSDGRIDNYIGSAGVEPTLLLHDLQPKQSYLLGMFLIGAYQEILGDMHNLFGDTHSVDVQLDMQGKPVISNIEYGDSVAQVLELVHYDQNFIMHEVMKKINQAGLSQEQQQLLQKQLLQSLQAYTYLESNLLS